MSRNLSLAIHMWRQGHPIPVDLELKLMDEGLDVPRLEQRYRA